MRAEELMAQHEAKRRELQARARGEQVVAAVRAERSGTTMTGRQWDVYFAAREALLHVDVRLRTEPFGPGGRAVELFGSQGGVERSVIIGRAELVDPELMQRELTLLCGRLFAAGLEL
jgi:hypothetical protein